MIVKYYKGYISMSDLENLLNTNKDGTSAYKIVEGLRKLGFESQGIKTTLSEVTPQNLILPCIAFVTIDEKYNHYVVIYKINFNKKKILIAHTIYFLVEEIPPAPDGLGKQESNDHTITHTEKVYLFEIGKRRNTRRTADDSPDDRESATSYRLPTKPFCDGHSVRDTVKHTRRQYGNRQANNKKGHKQVGGHISAFEKQRDDDERRQHSKHDKNGIPIDMQAKNINVGMVRPFNCI